MFDLDHIFKYHHPTNENILDYLAIRDAAKAFAVVMLEHTPEGADQAAALRLIREASMTANAAIALGGRLNCEALPAKESITFHINGAGCLWIHGDAISYERICEIAELDPTHNPSVTVAYRNSLPDRCLTHGQEAVVIPGTVINACYTGNA